MSIILSLSTLAVRQLVEGACAAIGVQTSGERAVGFLTERFADHSQRLTAALQSANEKAWKALEIALAGDSLWDRCKVMVARAEDKAFGQQVRVFLDASPLPELAGKTALRQKCLDELRAARKAGALTSGSLDHRQLAQQAAGFVRFADPASQLETEWQVVQQMAEQIHQAGFPSLGWLLSQRPLRGMPVLVVGVRYFFRRAVEEDQKLFQGLAFAKLEALGEAQERGFAALSGALTQRGQRLEELLGDVKAVVVQTHSAVLDLQSQIKGQSEQMQQIGQAVLKLLEQHQLQRRELRPADSLSLRNESERKVVKQLVERYRALPDAERKRLPALLNAVGKLEVVTGDFNAAQKDFQQVATLVADTAAQAEAHFNAYRTALERQDWATALAELLNAVKLDAKRFAPFPVGKYHPQRILGAGGFGVAFSCRHKELQADVVIKTLVSDDLDRYVDEVFNEARVLYQLDHPAIIRLLNCGYTIPAENARPYFVMSFFDGVTLEDYVQKNGPLPPDDLIAVARQMAEGLQAAHSKNILHRDVKPANVLVRKDATGWQVKLIDFGLALKHQAIAGAASTAKQKQTIVASSIAGTLDYGAPEQTGRLLGVPIGPYSDVYGWAKTCCCALFKTTQPLPKHWHTLPKPLADLLEKCLDEDLKERPSDFAEVLTCLPMQNRVVVEEQPSHFGSSRKQTNTASVKVTTKKYRQKLLPWVPGSVAVLAVILILAVWFLLPLRTKEVRELAEGNQGTIRESNDKEANKGVPEQNTAVPLGEPKELLTLRGHTNGVMCVAFSPDGQRIVSGDSGHTVKVWNAETGKECLSLDGHANAVRGVSFSPDGKQIATASQDSTVRVWDSDSGEQQASFNVPWDCLSVAFSPDGKQLVVGGGRDGILQVWDALNGKELYQLRGHKWSVLCVCFSPDNEYIASGATDWEAKVWDAHTGSLTLTLVGNTQWVHGVCFSPDSKRLVTGSGDKTVRVWNGSSGKELFKLLGHTGGIKSVVFSPDGKTIASGSEDTTLKLWDVAAQQLRTTLRAHRASVNSLAFRGDSKVLASGSADGTVKVWSLPAY